MLSVTIELMPNRYDHPRTTPPSQVAGFIRAGIAVLVLFMGPLGPGWRARAEDSVLPADNPGALQGLGNDDTPNDLKSRFGDALSVKPNYFYRDPRAPVLLMDDGLRHDAVDLAMSSKLPGGLTGEGQVAFNSFNTQADRLTRDRQHRFMRFKLAGDAQGFGYGSEFRSAGLGFQPASGGSVRRDREGTESWVDRKIGWFTLKAINTKYWNNVDADPHRTRTITSLNGTSATFGPPSWPSLTLSYMTGTAETGGGPMTGIQQSTVQQYSASVYYWRPKWNVSLMSMYTPSKDKFRPDQETDSLYHEVSMTFRPTDAISISPYLAYSDDRYRWTGSHASSPMAMLSVSWGSLFNLVDFYSYSSYMRSKSTDGYVDNTTIMSINSFVYQLGKKKNERYLSFDIVYMRYADAVYRSSSYENLLGRVMYTVATF